MSLFDYQASKQIAALDAPFAALIMAAYRKADTGNAIQLEQAFPEICREIRKRYNAPGGLLPSERTEDLLGALQESVARARTDRQSRAES